MKHSQDPKQTVTPDGAPRAADAPPPAPVNTSRRRFGKAGLAAPVIMTLASRPVWATGRLCTVSALASANPSQPVDESTCSACSPGYWHHERACWPEAAGYNRGTPFYVQFGYDISHYETQRDEGQTVNNNHTSYADIVTELSRPLEEFFPSGGGTPLFKAMRAMLAAMLNADHPHVPFVMHSSEVRSQFEAVFPPLPPSDLSKPTAKNSQLNDLAISLSANWDENSEECILPNSGNCP